MIPNWQHPFQQFPDNHVRAAFRQALLEDVPDIVLRAHEICWRWQQDPLAADCPPAYGSIAIPASVPTETIPASAPRLTRLRSLLARHKTPEIRQAFEKRGLPQDE